MFLPQRSRLQRLCQRSSGYALGALVAAGCSCASGQIDGSGGGGTPVSIELVPASATLLPGNSQVFIAICRDTNLAILSCPALSWNASGGTFTVSSDSSGSYAAGSTIGSFSLAASGGGLQAAAPVVIAAIGAAPNVTLDTTQHFQTMRGWEATLNIDTYSANYSAALRTRIIDSATVLGINRVRLQAQGQIIESLDRSLPPQGRTATNDNADPLSLNPAGFWWNLFDYQVRDWVLPLKARVEAGGDPFTLNVNYVGFKASTAFQQTGPTGPAEYGEFVLTVLNRLKTTWNLQPDIWEARLEPDVGLAITGTELGQMIVAAGNRIQANGFTTLRFAVPSNTQASSAVTTLAQLLAVPGASSLVGEVTYHRYRTAPTTQVLNSLRNAAAPLGAETAMLEHIGADVNELYQDLTQANTSSWSQFVLEGTNPDDGGHLYIVDPVNGTFVLSATGRYLRQYFAYVRPGAVRVGVSSNNPVIQPVAFRDRLGRFLVVANVSAAANLAIGGLPAGTYHVSFTTAGQSAALGAPISIVSGQTLSTVIPSAGVITIFP